MRGVLTDACAQGPLLASLSSYRFIAHSFAPVLSLVAAEQAARAGVAWAGSPFVQGEQEFALLLSIFVPAWLMLLLIWVM